MHKAPSRLIQLAALGATLACASLPAAAADFASCVLDRMPGTRTADTYLAVLRTCKANHPEVLQGIRKGSGRGPAGFADGAACTQAKAKDIAYPPAATAVGLMCSCLYNAPATAGARCADDFAAAQR